MQGVSLSFPPLHDKITVPIGPFCSNQSLPISIESNIAPLLFFNYIIIGFQTHVFVFFLVLNQSNWVPLKNVTLFEEGLVRITILLA